MFDWTSDPDTLWLNLTNAGLGICVLVCLAVVVIGITRDVLAKSRAKALENREVYASDAYSMLMPDLGLTMADGGEPVDEDKKKKR